MCFDVCVMTSLSPYCCLSPDCPQGMDESEMGADVILIIICQDYQRPITHLLCSSCSAKFCVCAPMCGHCCVLANSNCAELLVLVSFSLICLSFFCNAILQISYLENYMQWPHCPKRNKLCQSLGNHLKQETFNHVRECLRPQNAFPSRYIN